MFVVTLFCTLIGPPQRSVAGSQLHRIMCVFRTEHKPNAGGTS